MSRRTIIIMGGVLALAVALLALGECGYEKLDSVRTMESAVASVRGDYPQLRSIRPKALAAYQDAGIPLVLVDVREEEEFTVSHIDGAQHLTSVGAVESEWKSRNPRPEAVVLYGSLGFRSAEVADELRESGLVDVEHLEGGVFQWANEGYPLVDANGEPTTFVHPYNEIWGRLLEEEHRAPPPD